MKLDQVLNQDIAQTNSNVEDKILSIKDISVLVNPYFYVKKGKEKRSFWDRILSWFK